MGTYGFPNFQNCGQLDSPKYDREKNLGVLAECRGKVIKLLGERLAKNWSLMGRIFPDLTTLAHL